VVPTSSSNGRPSRSSAKPATPKSTPAPKARATEQAADDDKTSRASAPAPEVRARHAHLYVTHLDPWSVMKNAVMLSLAIAVVMVIAVTVLWSLLALGGTLDALTRTITDIAGGGADTIDAANLFSFSRVIGVTAVLALLEVILISALTTLFAFMYNISVGITGGLQVTLTDDS
jgi:hypothetical protein